MRLAIRWKLMGSYLLLIALTGGAFVAYQIHTLEQRLTDEVIGNLFISAHLARLMASREVHDITADAPSVASAIGREIGVRTTIIDKDGEVVGDSDVPPERLGELDNHASRPEVRDALLKRRGHAIRYSATVKANMLYVALPLPPSDAPAGVLRLARPLADLERARDELHATVGVSLAFAVALALVLSYLLSNFTSRRLREISAIATRIGKGELGSRVPVRSRDELGELARVMNEMAARLQAEMESLAAGRNRLDAILRGMGEGLLVADAAGTVTLVNPAFRTLFGLSGEATGRPLIDLSRHPALHETFRTVQATGAEQVAEVALPHEERTLLTHWVPLLEEGRFAGVVAVFHDISDLKRLERIRRDFVANVSHELRTPVTVIKGYAETLTGGLLASDPAAAERFVAVIQAHAGRLASLIGDLLTLSELEAGGFALELAPAPLAAVAGHCCALLEPKAAEKQIALDCAGVPELAVLADRRRLEQVLVNLLDNAVKYTPQGGRVTLQAEAAGELVRVAVRDTGQGIPPQAVPRIFERFYRVDAGRSREEGGTGLGLAIVKHIVQAHGGSVAVESTPGKGSTFTFTLRKA
jgi:two-component system phosphate regulon sensor histidine kinase PhoR